MTPNPVLLRKYAAADNLIVEVSEEEFNTFSSAFREYKEKYRTFGADIAEVWSSKFKMQAEEEKSKLVPKPRGSSQSESYRLITRF